MIVSEQGRGRGRPRAIRQDAGLEAALMVASGVEIAAAIGLTPSAVSAWRRVPLRWCRKVEALTGISRVRLRPDHFGGLSLDLALAERGKLCSF